MTFNSHRALVLLVLVTHFLLTGTIGGRAASCLPTPEGIVARWTFNENGDDLNGGHDFELLGAPSFIIGKVGNGIALNGVNDYAFTPADSALDIGTQPGFTIESWINPTFAFRQMAIVEWSDLTSLLGLHFYVSAGPAGSLYANLIARNGAAHSISGSGGILTGEFSHVALTYDKAAGLARLYLNGAIINEATLGTFDPETRPGLYLGRRMLGGVPYPFGGTIDDMGIYRRALTSQEIASVYQAGSAGKCMSGPPIITLQPQSKVAPMGSTVEFSVAATGALPISFQWRHDGIDLIDSTNSSIVLTNIQNSNIGAYSVRITNPFGEITSSNASLALGNDCALVGTGIVGWWPLDGSGEEIVGGSSLTLYGAPQFVPGMVKEALLLSDTNGLGSVASSPLLNVGEGLGMTIELWIKPTTVNSPMALVEWSDSNSVGSHFYVSTSGTGTLFANLISQSGVSHHIQSPSQLIIGNEWQHVALTFDKSSGLASLFRNGIKVTEALLGNFSPETRLDIQFGRRIVGGAQYRFRGVLDEAGIYNRALSAAELRAIFTAGSRGKCGSDSVPYIISQPTSKFATLGQSTDFSVSVTGSRPISYQWYFESNAILGATNSNLFLQTVAFADAGAYRVVASNSFGSMTSETAVLTVNYPSAHLAVISTETIAGGTVTVPIELTANGNENGVSFSLSFDPAKLMFVSGTLASNLLEVGATLIINTNSSAGGSVGVSIALLPGQTMAQGTQRLGQLEFQAAPTDSIANYSLKFSDQPVTRQLSSVTGTELSAVYTDGTIAILPSTIRVGTGNAISGGSASLPITLYGMGNENAIAFSLSFSNSVLSFANVEVGGGLPAEASLLVNTNLAGRIGISIALPAGVTFPRGTTELASVRFEVGAVLTLLTTPVRVVDNPVVRQVANVTAQVIPSAFQGGSVSVTEITFEADVAPRTGGDRVLTVIDWVQAGRFAAALDIVQSNEFQRVDCAPRQTRGNGVISVADWVQAGRYSAGLDPVTGIGGPTEPLLLSPASLPAGNTPTTKCYLGYNGTSKIENGVLMVPVTISASGTENALGFSVGFPTSTLRYLGVSKTGLQSATLNVNAYQSSAGQIGLALALPTGTSLPVGSHEIAVLSFQVIQSAFGTASVVFTDLPVVKEVVGPSANSLPSKFESTQIVLDNSQGPVLSIARSGENVILHWSAADGGYSLFSSDTPTGGEWSIVNVPPLEIGGQNVISVPRVDIHRYYRLVKP